MFKKTGDALPVSVIEPSDVDVNSTKRALNDTIKKIEQDEKDALVNKTSEKK